MTIKQEILKTISSNGVAYASMETIKKGLLSDEREVDNEAEALDIIFDLITETIELTVEKTKKEVLSLSEVCLRNDDTFDFDKFEKLIGELK